MIKPEKNRMMILWNSVFSLNMVKLWNFLELGKNCEAFPNWGKFFASQSFRSKTASFNKKIIKNFDLLRQLRCVDNLVSASDEVVNAVIMLYITELCAKLNFSWKFWVCSHFKSNIWWILAGSNTFIKHFLLRKFTENFLRIPPPINRALGVQRYEIG